MATLIFHGQFHDEDGVGKTGLTVTVNVYRTALADGATTQVVTAGAAAETGGGIYRYRLADADLATYHYVANLVTASEDAVQRHVAALGIVVPDVLVSSRLAPATAGRTLAVDASGNAAANVTYWAGQATSHTDGTPDTNLKWINGVQLASTSSEGYLPAEIDAFSEVAIRTAIGLATANMDTQLAAVAKTGADGDTLETLSDQIDAAALEATAQAILEDTGTTLPALIGGLSGATVKVVSSVDGGTVTVYAADTWRFTVFSDQLALADYETLGLIVKRDARQTDNQALLYVRSDTGLARIDGAAPSSAANGALTAGVGSFSAVVHVAETAGVGPGSYTWWLKGIDTTPTPDEAVTLATGRFVVLAAGLQAVV